MNSKKYIGQKAVEHIKVIETILGKKKTQSYYDNDNITGIMDELRKHLSTEEFELLIDLLEKEASYYKKNEDLERLLKRESKEQGKETTIYTMSTSITRLLTKLCCNIRDDEEIKVDVSKMIIDYYIIDKEDDNEGLISFHNYWNSLYGSNLGECFERLELILGKEKIQEIYNSGNIGELQNELSKYLSAQEIEEMYSIIESDVCDKKSLIENEAIEVKKQKLMKIIQTLCLNMKQEGLASIFEFIDTKDSGLEIHYLKDKVSYSYIDPIGDYNSIIIHGIIDREQLMKMDYETFIKYIKEQNIQKSEKKEENTAKKQIQLTSQDLVSYSLELLQRGSGGSIICDAVDIEIRELQQENEQENEQEK